MHELKSTPKRYQNPELFEILAMKYAVGSLQGRARQRFEVLMETHFYLRAIADAYEAKFANLVELLPEKQPSQQVWENIDAHLKKNLTVTTPQVDKSPWWQMNFFKQSFGFAVMALIVSVVLFYNPMTGHDPAAVASYTVAMESNENGELVAITKIKRSNLKLSIDILKPMYVDDGMELTLWCHPKKGGDPVRMGVISKSGKTELTISEKEWKGLKNASQLKVSIEVKGAQNISAPSNKILFNGQLNATG